MRYTEHPFARKLNDSSIYDYKPEWTKNNSIEDMPKKIPKKTTKKRKYELNILGKNKKDFNKNKKVKTPMI